MRNKHFPDETITFNDLYFVCYMIERVARAMHRRNRYVVRAMGHDGLWHELSTAAVNHCLNPQQLVDDWISLYHIEPGNVDVTQVDPRFTDKVPTPTQMGKVYARLIESVSQEEDLPNTMMQVYDSPLCDTIDNYNSSAYYEPSYVQTRAYFNGGF